MSFGGAFAQRLQRCYWWVFVCSARFRFVQRLNAIPPRFPLRGNIPSLAGGEFFFAWVVRFRFVQRRNAIPPQLPLRGNVPSLAGGEFFTAWQLNALAYCVKLYRS